MRRMFSKKQIENIADGVVDTALEELTIPETKIDSGEAEAGKVLKADGEGGAEWGDDNALPDTYEAHQGDVLEIDGNGDPNWDKLEGIYIGSHNASSGQVLMANGSGSASWQTPATYMSNPMTAAGDLIVGGNAGAAGRLGLGTSGQVVQSNGTGVEWADNVPASVSYLTTAPSSDNTSGRLTFVILNSDPATKYNGYFYIILGS